jgi:hypothetical protein
MRSDGALATSATALCAARTEPPLSHPPPTHIRPETGVCVWVGVWNALESLISTVGGSGGVVTFTARDSALGVPLNGYEPKES